MRKISHWQRGQGLSEYAVILGLVALVAALVLGLLGLAISRQYGLVAGVLGTRKDVDAAQYKIIFDQNAPQCGWSDSAIPGGEYVLYMQFTSDVPIPSLSATTENSQIPLEITENPGAGPGIGNMYINYDMPPGMPCPLSVVIQSDQAHGGRTVVWNVLHKDFPG